MWVVAAFACVLALAACSSGGGGDEAAPETETATTAVETGESSATPVATDGVDPCELVDAEAAEAELGASVTTSSVTTDTSGQRCDYADDSGTSVLGIQVELGHTQETYRARVEVGGPIEELSSAPGDAIWSAERRVLATLVGDAFVQVVQRPDAPVSAADAQAAALRLLELVVAGLPGGAATSTAAPAAPLDPASLSFVDNLLARVDRGEWTMEDGLIATLELMAGKRSASDVLATGDVDDREGTGIIALAREYAATGSDDAARAEIAGLLERLVFTPEQLEAMVAPTTASGTAEEPSRRLAGTASSEEDCTRFYGGYAPAQGVEQCLAVDVLNVQGVEFRVYRPAPSLPQAGWTDGHFGQITTAVRESIEHLLLVGQMRSGVVVVTAIEHEGGAAATATPILADTGNAVGCTVTVHPLLAREFSGTDFKQVIAHEFGHCFQAFNFPDQEKPGYDVTRWREEGLAEYLGNLIYPPNDLEIRARGPALVAGELASAIVRDRSYSNAIFFQFLENRNGGPAAVLALIGTLPASGGIDEQEQALTAAPDVSSGYHEFVRQATDGDVVDRGGARWPALDEVEGAVGAGAGTVERLVGEVRVLGVGRAAVRVAPGHSVEIQVEVDDGVEFSVRDSGSPGSWGVGAQSFGLVAQCDAQPVEKVVVFSTTVEDASYQIDVTESQELDCGEPSPAPSKTLHCLVGEWKLVLGPPFMMNKVPLELTPTMQADMVFAGSKGDVTVALREGGTFDLVISNFDETIEFRTHGIVTKSNGSGTGTWKVNGDRLSVVLTGRNFKTELGGTIGGASAKPLNAPPTYTYLWNDGRYTCTDERFGFTFPDGMSVSYVRR
jgi:hypothetical protein